MRSEPNRVDLHYHVIPKPYVEALRERGITGSTYVRFPKWTPQKALGHLDRTGVRTAVTSLSTPGVWFGDEKLARKLSRLCNEFQARMMADHPDRFGSFACLPLPDVAGALEELEYALDDLGLDGVVLLSDTEGRYLGDPDYEELFGELNRRRAVVFIHPHDDPTRDRRYGLFSPLLEWPIHTTRAALDLLYSGRLARYPDIRYVLAHGGGTVPYLAHRLAAGMGAEHPAHRGDLGSASLPGGSRGEGLELLRSLYYDTAAPGDAHLSALQEFVGPSHLVFGTDGGWTPPVQTAQTIQALLAFDGFSPGQLTAIEGDNAAELFPRLRPASPHPPPERTGVRLGDGASRVTLKTQPEIPDPSVLVDIHHHMVPPGYLEALQRAGLDVTGFPTWAPERSLGMMDRLGIGKALVSLSSPGVWFGDDADARRLARSCNEYAASLVGDHGGRFGALATLPFPDLQGAIEEVEYALGSLHLDGVILLSNVHGRYVGDPEFDALMAELDRRKALTLLHPNAVPPEHETAPLYPWAEYPIDMARAHARMVYNDTLVRYPRIRWVLAHAGGIVPFLADRLGKAHYAREGGLRWGRILKDLTLKRNGGLELAKHLGYDTVGATNPVTLASLQRLVEPEGIRFGSNFPWDSQESVETSVRFLESREGTPLSGNLARHAEEARPRVGERGGQ